VVVSAGFHDLLMLLSEQGFGGMAQGLELLFNEAMKLEHTAFLGAQPFERIMVFPTARRCDNCASSTAG
jgi:hypothetical protein